MQYLSSPNYLNYQIYLTRVDHTRYLSYLHAIYLYLSTYQAPSRYPLPGYLNRPRRETEGERNRERKKSSQSTSSPAHSPSTHPPARLSHDDKVQKTTLNPALRVAFLPSLISQFHSSFFFFFFLFWALSPIPLSHYPYPTYPTLALSNYSSIQPLDGIIAAVLLWDPCWC